MGKKLSEGKRQALIIILSGIVIIIAVIVIIYMIYSFLKNQTSGNKVKVGIVGFSSVTSNNDEDNENSSTEEEELIETIEEISAYNDSYAVRTFVNTSWSRMSTMVSSDYEKDENGNYVYEGYTVYSDNGTFVKYIIFNEDYDSAVIESLSVGASYDEVVAELGEPTFYDKTVGVYGYKTTTVYAFFYDNEIIIYPNFDVTNTNFEEFLFNYVSGNYSGNQTNFVVEIRQNYDDFSIIQDGEDIVMTSLNRKIQVRLNGTAENTVITIYNGYASGDLMNQYLDDESENIVDNREVDLVFQTELERIAN